MKLAGFTDEAAKDIAGQVRALIELGWNSMELRTVDDICVHDLDDPCFDQIKKVLDENQISVCCLGSTIANWGQSVHKPYTETKEAVRRAIRCMKQLHVPFVRIMSYSIKMDEQGRALDDQHEEKRFSRLRDICAMFLDESIVPVHENCHTYGGMSWEHTLRLVEEIPGLKLVYDTGNPAATPDFRTAYPYEFQDPWDFYRNVKDHIAHMHIKDVEFDKEKHIETYCFPGEGDSDVMRIVTDLLRTGYDGTFSIEPHMAVVFHDPSVTADATKRFQNFVEYGRRFQKMLVEAKNQI